MPDEEQEGSANDAPDAEAKPEGESEASAEAKPERPAKKAKDEEPAGKPAPAPGGIADLIKEALPDIHVEVYQELTHVVVEIGRDDVGKAMPVLRDDPRLDLKFLRCLFGVDHQEEGLEVIYQLLSLDKHHEVAIKTKLARDDARVASVTPLWNAANWHERETRDMFGIEFEGHPHLVPLLLPEDMTDHFPLLKDNPLATVEEWQGELLGPEVGRAGHVPSGSAFEGAGDGDEGEEA